MKNIAAVLLIALIISVGIIYTLRPKNSSINVKPMNPAEQALIKTGGSSGVVIVATTNDRIKLSETTKTNKNIVDKYLEKYMGQSFAYSERNGTTTYYLPPEHYTAISRAVMGVISAYPEADKYYTVIGNPDSGIKNLSYCPQYQTDPIAFANNCGNDLNFFEAYAFLNFQTPFTMIIVMNPASTHIAYAFNNYIYDVFNTYNYSDYLTRVIYKYDPTAAYIIVFNTSSISISPIPLIPGVHRADVEATGTVSGTPVTMVVRQDYFLLSWGTLNITRDGATFIYNNATLDYYPVNVSKIEPIDPVIANATDTNYLYINGETFTLIPTRNLTDDNVTIVAYEVFNGPPAGSITVTYYG